jgi:putative phosphoserine phosphatase/1-acylglycerol-3-phosphate O-acyltransferase
MNTNKRSYPAFFDLDHTILSLNSGSQLVRNAYKKGIMSTGNLLNAIIQAYLYKYSLRDTNLIISKMGSWVKGVDPEVIKELSGEVVENHLIKNIRPEVIKEIDFHKRKNAATVILSSSVSTICEPIAGYLGFDDVICSTLEISNGFLTGAPVGKFCFEDEKRLRMLSYCENNHFDPAEAWYYADSIADIPVFEVVGHPVCVSPDNKLAKIALKKGWRVIG